MHAYYWQKNRHHTKALVKIINENGILIYLFAEAGSRSTPGWYDTRVLPDVSKEELAFPDGALVMTLTSALLDATICCVVCTTSIYYISTIPYKSSCYFITHG
jgi:hypothetical protein